MSHVSYTTPLLLPDDYYVVRYSFYDLGQEKEYRVNTRMVGRMRSKLERPVKVQRNSVDSERHRLQSIYIMGQGTLLELRWSIAA